MPAPGCCCGWDLLQPRAATNRRGSARRAWIFTSIFTAGTSNHGQIRPKSIKSNQLRIQEGRGCYSAARRIYLWIRARMAVVQKKRGEEASSGRVKRFG